MAWVNLHREIIAGHPNANERPRTETLSWTNRTNEGVRSIKEVQRTRPDAKNDHSTFGGSSMRMPLTRGGPAITRRSPLHLALILVIVFSAVIVSSPAWAACTRQESATAPPGFNVLVTATAWHGTTCPANSTIKAELWHQKVGPDSLLVASSPVMGSNATAYAERTCLVTGGSTQAAYYAKGISSAAGSGTSGILWKDC